MTLQQAIEAADVATLRALLKPGADLEKADERGNTPLMLACSKGDPEIVKLLLQAGADVYNDTYSSPLILAAGGGHAEVVKMLLDAEAFVRGTDKTGADALMRAAAGGYLGVVRLLVERGANPDWPGPEKRCAVIRATLNGHRQVVEYLRPRTNSDHLRRLDGIMRWKSGDGGRATPPDPILVLDAADTGELGPLKEYVAAGSDVNTADEEGMTLLMRAANRGRLEVVEYLVGAGADVDRADMYGRNVLVLAALGESLTCFEFLYPLCSQGSRLKGIEAAETIKHQNSAWKQWEPPAKDKPQLKRRRKK